MNFFGGFGNGLFGKGGCEGRNDNDCCCSIIWLLFLLQLCGNGCGEQGMHNNDCCDIIMLLLLLSCICK